MGFFGKLFEKKECAICGGEIGMLGNRKLEDGNMCKNCAAKLSPWFDDRRHSTVAQINEQLAYREENKAKVAAFHTSRVFGEYTKLYLDEEACAFMVTSANTASWGTVNPDVIACADVIGCEVDVNENKVELFQKDKEGKQVSYNPPRYRYDYQFYMELKVNNPYFDDIRFLLNSSPVSIENAAVRRPAVGAAGRVVNNTAYGFNPERYPEYRKYQSMGEEVKEALMNSRKKEKEIIRQQEEPAAVAAAPNAKVICPYCGADTIPDAAGNCEYCGAPVND